MQTAVQIAKRDRLFSQPHWKFETYKLIPYVYYSLHVCIAALANPHQFPEQCYFFSQPAYRKVAVTQSKLNSVKCN